VPTVRYTGDGRYRVAGNRFESGDEAEVSDGLAQHLVDDVGEFELVDADEGGANGTETDDADVKGGDDADSTEADSEASDDGSNGGAGVFELEAWLDQDYRDRADRVRAGDVDEHLELLKKEETSNNVTDAIDERRAELE